VDWNPEAPASGCGCTVVDARANYGALILGIGLAAGFGVRRRRSPR
jgi:MYXO-CTERM domain-containing protein